VLNFWVIEILVESLSRDARLIYALASLALWASPGDHWITLNWQHSCYFLPWSSRKLSAIELSLSCQPNMSTEQTRLSCSTLHVESRIIPTNILPMFKHPIDTSHPVQSPTIAILSQSIKWVRPGSFFPPRQLTTQSPINKSHVYIQIFSDFLVDPPNVEEKLGSLSFSFFLPSVLS
jgi:hypothetical protein